MSPAERMDAPDWQRQHEDVPLPVALLAAVIALCASGLFFASVLLFMAVR